MQVRAPPIGGRGPYQPSFPAEKPGSERNNCNSRPIRRELYLSCTRIRDICIIVVFPIETLAFPLLLCDNAREKNENSGGCT